MQIYFFDKYGYYQGGAWRDEGHVMRDNETTIEPPFSDGKVPKWGGSAWELAQPPAPIADRKAQILAELTKIDAATDTPRARREALLGNTAWLEQQDAKARLLRAELTAL